MNLPSTNTVTFGGSSGFSPNGDGITDCNNGTCDECQAKCKPPMIDWPDD